MIKRPKKIFFKDIYYIRSDYKHSQSIRSMKNYLEGTTYIPPKFWNYWYVSYTTKKKIFFKEHFDFPNFQSHIPHCSFFNSLQNCTKLNHVLNSLVDGSIMSESFSSCISCLSQVPKKCTRGFKKCLEYW